MASINSNCRLDQRRQFRGFHGVLQGCSRVLQVHSRSFQGVTQTFQGLSWAFQGVPEVFQRISETLGSRRVKNVSKSSKRIQKSSRCVSKMFHRCSRGRWLLWRMTMHRSHESVSDAAFIRCACSEAASLGNFMKEDAAGVWSTWKSGRTTTTSAHESLQERFNNWRLILEWYILGILNQKKMTRKLSNYFQSLINVCTFHVWRILSRSINRFQGCLSPIASIGQIDLPKYGHTIEFLKQCCAVLERYDKSASSVSPSS